MKRGFNTAAVVLTLCALVATGCKGSSDPTNDALVGDWVWAAISRDGGAFQSCPTTVGAARCGASDILRLQSNGTYVASDGDLFPEVGTWRRDRSDLIFRSSTGVEQRVGFVLVSNTLDLTTTFGGSVYVERLRRF